MTVSVPQWVINKRTPAIASAIARDPHPIVVYWEVTRIGPQEWHEDDEGREYCTQGVERRTLNPEPADMRDLPVLDRMQDGDESGTDSIAIITDSSGRILWAQWDRESGEKWRQMIDYNTPHNEENEEA